MTVEAALDLKPQWSSVTQIDITNKRNSRSRQGGRNQVSDDSLQMTMNK